MNIGKLWLVIGLLTIVSLTAFAQSSKQLRIGLIADIQYADKDDANNRYYRNSIDKAHKAIEYMNQGNLDAIVVLGDYVDEGPKDLKPLLQQLEKANVPIYGVLGNHDFPKDQDKKLYLKFRLPAPYYSKEFDDWRFIFLNTNEISTYAVYGNKKLNDELYEMLNIGKKGKRKNMHPWNGGVGKHQMKWLKKEIEKAGIKQQKVIVFSHHPLFPENGLEALNNREILNLLTDRREVKAVISGHHHEGNFEMYEDLPCITLEGLIETKNQSASGIMELSSDSLVIHGSERMTSRDIQLR